MIQDPNEEDLQQIGSIHCLASIPEYVYRRFRDESTWVLYCATFQCSDIYNKMEAVIKSTTIHGHDHILLEALLVSFSFKKYTEAKPYLDEINENGNRWFATIKSKVIEQCKQNG